MGMKEGSHESFGLNTLMTVLAPNLLSRSRAEADIRIWTDLKALFKLHARLEESSSNEIGLCLRT